MTVNERPRRRWCVFLTDLHGGGAERMMVQLAAGFARRGIEVDLVLARAAGPFLGEVPDDVRVVDLAAGRTSRALVPFVRYLRRERPEVVFTSLRHTSVIAAVARALSSRSMILVLREATTPSRRTARRDVKDWVLRLLARRTYAAADAIVAVSEGVAADLQETYAVPADRIHTLYSPLVTKDLEARAQEPADHPWLSNDTVPVLLAVGALKPYKGFDMLLEAVASMRRHRDVRLVVLGEGDHRAALEARAHDLGITEHVAFVGFRINPFAYMARAAVFALSSEREGLPGALVQALACGTPVVATDCPSGPAEVLEGGAYGRLVPVGDADAMANALEATLNEPRDPDRASARAARFDADHVIDAHVTVFDELVDAKSRRARAPRVTERSTS